MEFEGFTLPTKNYFSMPNNWTDITAEIDSLAELKVVEYVLRHTWGYKEYGTTKTISVDEFVNGRRRQDGSRMDRGTGLKSDRSVKDGLKLAIEHGYLICEIDTSDLGRTKKSYALKVSTGIDTTPQVDTTPGVDSDTQTGRYYPPEGYNLPPRGVDTTPRSEKDTLETHPKKDTLETHPKKPAPAKKTQPPAENKKPVFELTLQQNIFWGLWCDVWFNQDIPPKLTETAYGHVKKLAPHITTADQLKTLIEYARAQLGEKGKRKQLYLGDLVNSYPGWKQSQASQNGHAPGESTTLGQYQHLPPIPAGFKSVKIKQPVPAGGK